MRHSLPVAAIFVVAVACQNNSPEHFQSAPPAIASASFEVGDEMESQIDFNWNALIDGDEGELIPDEALLTLQSAGPVALVTRTIDFETPRIPSGAGQLVIDPYVDAATGVSFHTLGANVVGLVKNNSTSACTDPPNNDQKLASGPGIIGFSSFPIFVEFPAPLPPPCTVSMEVQTGQLVDAWLQLVHPDGTSTAIVQRMTMASGDCGFPGGSRSRMVISATSDQPVVRASIRMLQTGRVFVIDNFTFSFAPAQFALDIRPGSCRNPLSPKSMGLLPVALLGTDMTSVDQVDTSTLLLAGLAPSMVHMDDVSGPGDGSLCACPVDGPDGKPDLIMHFEVSDVLEALGAVEPGQTIPMELTGELLDGTPFKATDCLSVTGSDEEELTTTTGDAF